MVDEHQPERPVHIEANNDTPNGSRGGIWHSGQGPSADSTGNVHVLAGNGTFDANLGGPDLADSFIKLVPTRTH